MVTGETGAAICNQCVARSMQLLVEDRLASKSPRRGNGPILTGMGFLDLIAATMPTGTARFVLDTFPLGSDQAPVLIMRHAGDSNAAYASAVVKAANELRSRAAGSRITESKIAESRSLDARLFAQHVLVGWENVCETPGTPTPFSPAKAEELLLAIAAKRPDVLTLITSFARDADNFRDASVPTGDALGKG